MEENYNHNAWDTDCFGFGVARIIKTTMDETELSETLRILREKNYRMVDWLIPAELQQISSMAKSYGGCLADEKITYVKRRTGLLRQQDTSVYTSEPYTYTEVDPTLIKLALEISEYSRFRFDPRFPKELCDKLYTCWIMNSVSGEMVGKS